MKHVMHKLGFCLSLVFAQSALAAPFTLTSKDIAQGEVMGKAQEFVGFGCSGGNVSPQLAWSGAPAETAAFAILVHDADAPTGSGWWHWQVVNIPNNVHSLVAGAGAEDGKLLPAGSQQIGNDYGVKAFGGACPPAGHGVHHYRFTIYALSQKLELPPEASGALTGYMVNANSLASSTIEALYQRD